MSDIVIEHNPSPAKLEAMGVYGWPVWEKEASRFGWQYGTNETCYILEGEFTVTPDGGEPVAVKTGDLVHFPSGLACTWEVHTPVKKHYWLRE